MQMSVMPHENMYGAPKKEADLLKLFHDQQKEPLRLAAKEEKSLVESKSTSNVKVYTSPRKERLNKISGQVGKNEPFRAPVYTSYSECIKGIYRQGWLGFYKGNFMRQSYLLLGGTAQIEIAFRTQGIIGSYGFLNHLLGAIIADMFFHPLHLIESRYILQNRYVLELDQRVNIGYQHLQHTSQRSTSYEIHTPKCK